MLNPKDYPGDALGHLVYLSVEVEIESDDGEENVIDGVNIYVWIPNKTLEKDSKLECSYHECIEGCSWDDWTGPFREFMDDNMCETGCYEAIRDWENVRLDDERVQVAYIDPLNPDYSQRCFVKK